MQMTSFFINFLSLQLLVFNEQSKFNYRKKKIDVQDYGPPIFHDNLKNHLKVSILKMKFKINEEKQREGQLNEDSVCENFIDTFSRNGLQENIGSRN